MSDKVRPDGYGELWQAGKSHPYLPDYMIVEEPNTETTNGISNTYVRLEFTGNREMTLRAPRHDFVVSLPDWVRWKAEELWHVDDAARLVFAVSPSGRAPQPWPPGVVLRFADKIRTAIDAGADFAAPPKLALTRANGDRIYLETGTTFTPKTDEVLVPWPRVYPALFLQWASRWHPIPLELRPLLEQTAPEEPGAGAGGQPPWLSVDAIKLRLVVDGRLNARWPPRSEELLDKALAAFSTDNRPSVGLSISPAAPAPGEVWRRWHVNYSRDASGEGPCVAVIHFRDAPKGAHVDIRRLRGGNPHIVIAYLAHLVKALEADGLTLDGEPIHQVPAASATKPEAGQGGEGGEEEKPSGIVLGKEVSFMVPPNANISIITDSITVQSRNTEQPLENPPAHASSTPITPFPTPYGSSWEELFVTVHEHHLKAEIRGLIKDVGFVEAGFEEQRIKKVPDRLWKLLRILSFRGGYLSLTESSSIDANTKKNLASYVSGLRKRLRGYFEIDSNPIEFVDGQYHCIFNLNAGEGISFPTPAGTRWPLVSICEVREGTVRISVPTNEQFPAWGDGHGSRIAAERSASLDREYRLQTLGLVGDDGKPDGRAASLVEVLREGGKLKRADHNEDMLTLCRFLTDFMEIEESPFDYKSGFWIAYFSTSSHLAPDPH